MKIREIRGRVARRMAQESGEATEIILKVVLLCILYYGFIGIYDYIQEVKQDRIEGQQAINNPVKRPPGF